MSPAVGFLYHSVFLAGSGALQTRAMMLRGFKLVMVLLFCGLSGVSSGESAVLRASLSAEDSPGVNPNRNGAPGVGLSILGTVDKVFSFPGLTASRLQALLLFISALMALTVVCHMFPPQQGGASNNMRLPPRWDPSMEGSLPFRTWMQDLMLWTICTDLNPAQQCAAIISQLGGAARDLARTLTPAEVYHGGTVQGQQLDPVSFLLHGLQVRFAPLDEENRLRAAQDLLSFGRRAGESVDTLISRFEITRQRARDEGGGAISLETAALLLLRACGVSAEQFQSLTQPFGYRLPTTEVEFNQLGHHLRRMGHIVERFPNNIAAGLRQNAHFSQAFVAEADTGSSAGDQWQGYPSSGAEAWESYHGASAGIPATSSSGADWAYAALSGDPAASDTESATSSDNDEALPMDDLSGMAPAEVDEYLFGQYQHAKKRWRRFTGKPVRALRRTLRKKGKGKGKGQRHAFLNIGDVLQQSAYFRAKGKGGKSSGKGFGRKTNPTGRDGEPLRCSICGSSYHLRARCPRRTDNPGSQPASAQPQPAGSAFTVQSAGLHFATFESDGSWMNVPTPRSMTSAAASRSGSAAEPNEPFQRPHASSSNQVPTGADVAPSAPPTVHVMSPDPWQHDADPWMRWYNEQPSRQLPQPTAQQAVQETQHSAWVVPGIGNVGVSQTFSEVLGLSPEPPPVPAAFSRNAPSGSMPTWFLNAQQGIAEAQQLRAQQRRHSTSEVPQVAQVASAFARRFSDPMPGVPPAVTIINQAASSSSGSATQMAPAVPASVSVFSQVHALRQASSQAVPAASRVTAVPPAQTPGQPFTGFANTCTLCLSQYEPGDHVCRLSCGHLFHCLCIGELMMHDSAMDEGGALNVRCPNCRAEARVSRSWHYPRVEPEASDPVEHEGDQAQSEDASPLAHPPASETPEAYLSTPVPAQGESPEFMTPEAEQQAFPWWPVPSVPASTQAQRAAGSEMGHDPHDPPPQVTAYHSAVRLQDGRVGLLVDPGSYGNLVGELWLQEASTRLRRDPQVLPRSSPLQVGGVGRGAQVCHSDCRLPIAITRSDGSAATGSFTSPIVKDSACPALLGLRALAENRAILDLGTKQLHFLGEGEPILKLPPGSETFQLESAVSGHLLLPCSEFDRVPAGAIQGEHHLFTDDGPSAQHHLPSAAQGQVQVQVGPSEAASSSMQDPQSVPVDQVHLNEAAQEQLDEDERQCARVLAAFSYEAAAQLLVRLAKAWSRNGSFKAGPERFDEAEGLSMCLGMYMRGGMQGLTVQTKQRPQLARLLAAMLHVKCPEATFTSLMLSINVCAPLHLDRYNCGSNVVLPVLMPKQGGGLWIELTQGDTVRHPLAIKDHNGVPIAGQSIKLKENEPVMFCPKAKHCVEPWKVGDRITLAAFNIGSHYKVDTESRAQLTEMGFALPALDEHNSSRRTACAVVASSQDPQSVPDDQVPIAQASPKACAASSGSRSQPRIAPRVSGLGLLKRVLLITIYHSTMSAFLDHSWQPVKMRPLELLRDGFDDALTRMRRSEFAALWVDLADPRHFAGAERTTQVCNRLGTLIDCADRCDVPVFLAASRRTSWRHVAVENLVQKRRFYQSHHSWCRAAASVKPGIVSSVKIKVLSTKPLPNHDCQCQPGTVHEFDLDSSQESGYARARATAETKATGMIVSALSRALEARQARESVKPTDPVCSATSFVCATCGLQQPGAACMICEEAHQPATSQGIPVGTAHEASTAPRVFEDNDPVGHALHATVDPHAKSHGYPTEQKLQQKQRRQEQHAQGIEVSVRRKKKVVEQHFDDCGDDLSSLNIPACEYLAACSSESEGDFSDEAVRWVTPQLSQSSVWSFLGSAYPLPPDVPPGAMLATSIEEMYVILDNPSHASWGVEIVEICGGQGLTSFLCVKRRLRSGHCFELITGANLTDPAVQAKVIGYLDVAKPLILVMAPVCTPFGPLGRRNAVLHPEAWERSMLNAHPLARFCGQLAEYQLQRKRFYLNEQPFPSELYRVEPWPAVRQHVESYRVVFHQCMTGLRVNGAFAKKPTELVSNCMQILRNFSGLQCNNSHPHVSLLGGRADAAKRWSYNMCQRISQGIEQLVRSLAKHNQSVLKEVATNVVFPVSPIPCFPSVGSGPGDEGEVQVSEPWRKCKGCLWRLHKYDTLHTRRPGECKHPNVEPADFQCPGCVNHKPRSDASHTYGPDCRHALTSSRTSKQTRPYGRVPARVEPTSGARASRLGREAEQQAEQAAAGDAQPAPAEASPENVESAEPASSSSDPPVRRGRGPELEPRERRTWSEADVQTPSPSDWSSFDVQASMRGLRHGNEAQRRQILRKLHLRWWHCSTDRMTRILKAAGLGNEILDLVPAIQDTCKVCRHWARPQPDAKATCRMIVGFNIEVEGDLMFCRHQGRQNVLLVLADRGVRWVATTLVADRQTSTLLTGIDTSWISIFGPMQVLLFDGESGLDDEESTTFFQLRGITKRTSAPGQHTRVVDRKIQVLRDTIHKLGSQLHEEGLPVPFSRIAAESTYALNALSSVNGMSPYAAVLGRIPALLPSDDAVMDDNVSGENSRHMFRVREIAVQAIAEGTAQERMKRALHTKTQPAGVEFEFKIGQNVDYFRPPAHKDASGWRGPGTIVDLSRLEHGRVGVRTSTDQVITCRLQDVRHSLVTWSDELFSFFGAPDFISPSGTQAHQAQQVAQAAVDALRVGSVLTLGHVRTAAGLWTETPHTGQHRDVYQACMFVAETVFCLRSVVAVRLGRAIRSLTSREEFASSLCIWWSSEASPQLNFLHSEGSRLSIVDLVGQAWSDFRCMQFLSVPDEEDWAASIRWSVPSSDVVANEATPNVPAEAETPSSVARLSTIPEGSVETTSHSESQVSWAALCETFGDSICPEDRDALSQAYLANATEEAPPLPESASIADVTHRVQSLLTMDADIPSWTEVTAHQQGEEADLSFAATVASCNTEPSQYTVLDADEIGAYVAIDVYGDNCKLLEGLERMPNADEHAELRVYETHSRKVVIERSDDLLTAEEIEKNHAAVVQATIDELKTWEGFRCFARRPRKDAPCVIDVRWVHKWKVVRGERRIRSRLCLRGFKEFGADSQSNFAATASRFSQRLIVSECAAREWVIASSDVPKAFLQGISYEELAQATGQPLRDVSFELTGEGLRCLQTLPNFQGFNPATEVLHCLKPGTGCRDAPRCFSMKLRKVTQEFGLVCSIVDPEFEMLFSADSSELLMAIIKHVDDLKMIGSRKLIEKFVAHVSRVFGKMDVDWKEFTFCGVHHVQDEDGAIHLDQIKFLSACKTITSPCAIGGKNDTVLPEAARKLFLSLLMTVAYALLTRPDVAIFVVALQRESHRAQVQHVKRLNTLLKWLQQNPRRLSYPVMPYPDTLLQISDSSYRAKAEDGLSVRGLASLRVCSKEVLEGCRDTSCHLVDFVSKAQRHVTRSTFSSELFAATDSVDVGLLHSIMLHELKSGVVSTGLARQMIEGTAPCSVSLELVVDAKSVSSAVTAPNVKVPAEPSLLLHVAWLRSLLMNQRLRRLYWSDTRAMIADALTKGSVTRELLTAVMSGTLLMPFPYQDEVIKG